MAALAILKRKVLISEMKWMEHLPVQLVMTKTRPILKKKEDMKVDKYLHVGLCYFSEFTDSLLASSPISF